MPAPAPELPQFKSQPWKVFDTVVSRSFLLGENDPALLAIGTQQPAINAQGEMIFFASGRTQPNLPWYTSLQQVGELSYGFEVWQMAITFMLPPVSAAASATLPWESVGATPATSGMDMLANALSYFGVMEMELGQENQMSWPVHAFGPGGGVNATGGILGGQHLQNGEPKESNQLKLPEPIQIPRTQPLSAKIRLAAEVRGLIGTVAAPGVGTPLANYSYEFSKGSADLEPPPFGVRFQLSGRRIKKTQYGQLPPVLE
jgi:hypothetical protein